MFNFPKYDTIIYWLNNETSRYEKQPSLIPFTKLPFELKVEKTQDPNIINNGANEIITGRIKDKKRTFFTGLIATPGFHNWYYGNDYQFIKGAKQNSLVVFHFTNNFHELQVFYFNNYYKDSRTERLNFVINFIKSIQSK